MRTASALILVLLAAAGMAQTETPKPIKATIEEILKSPLKYDNKDVVVEGVVVEFRERTSRRGNKYTSLKISSAKKTLKVYLRGHLTGSKKPALKDTVEVTGLFRKEKKVGEVVFKNEIEATKTPKKPYGIKILKRGGSEGR